MMNNSILDTDDYSLIENSNDLFDNVFEPEVCNLDMLYSSPKDQASFSNQLGLAMEDIGLAILINHRFDFNTLTSLESKTTDFFERVPLERKLQYVSSNSKYGDPFYAGYVPLKESIPSLPNAVEAWEFYREAFQTSPKGLRRSATFWPDEKFELFYRKFWQDCSLLSPLLVRSLVSYLAKDINIENTPLSFFNDVFRLNYYPSIGLSREAQASKCRVLAHEDYGLLSIMPASSIDGFQVYRLSNNSWIRINAPLGSLIVISGKWLKIVSGSKFRACIHRVSVPHQLDQRVVPRVTVLYTLHPYENSIIESLPGISLRYPKMTGIEFMELVCNGLTIKCDPHVN